MRNNLTLARDWNSVAKKLGMLVVGICLFAALFIGATTVWTVTATHVAIPFSDEWSVIEQFIVHQNRLGLLWDQHNEHRIIFPKLFFLVDYILFDYTGTFLVVLILVMQAFTISALYLLVRNVLVDRKLLLGWTCTCIAAGLSGAQFENFTSVFQISFVGSYAGGAVAILGLHNYAQGGCEKSRWYWLSLAGALFATYSLASGLMIWPLLAALVYCYRLPKKIAICTWALFVFIWGTYLIDYHFHGGHANPLESLRHPVAVVVYLCAWVGNAVASLGQKAAIYLGACGLAVFGVAFFTGFKRLYLDRRLAEMGLMGFMLYVLSGGVLTALGRINFGTGQALSPRYVTPTLLFWMALLAFLLAGRRWNRSVRNSMVLSVCVVAIGLVMGTLVYSQGMYIAMVKQRAHIRGVAAMALHLKVRDSNAFAQILPAELHYLLEGAAYLREKKLSLFAGPTPYTLGSWIGEVGTVMKERKCIGHVDGLVSMPPGKMRINGWAWNNVDKKDFENVIFTDKSGRIIGFGQGHGLRPDVAKNVPQIVSNESGWLGYTSIEVTKLSEMDIYGRTSPNVLCKIAIPE